MYNGFYGLLRSPFEMTPDPSFLHLGETHREGLATLVYGGDWGIRLTPEDGSEPFGEPYLLLADDSMLTYRKK